MKYVKWAAKGLAVLLALVVVAVGALVAYASSSAEQKLQFPDTPRPAVAASTDPAVIEQGRYLVHGPAHCAQCHSTADRDHPEQIATHALTGGLEFTMGPIATTWSANLTPDPETGIGKLSDSDIARAVRTGVMHDGSYSLLMTLSAAKPSDADLTAIISYLRSLEPQPNPVKKGQWGLLGKVMVTFVDLKPATAPAPTHVAAGESPSAERGQYLSDNVALCTVCHTGFDMATFQPTGPKAGGGLAEPSHGTDTHMEFHAPNLTSDPTGITGKLDEEAFVARLKGGRVYASSIMPWENFAVMADDDARSIYRYLKALPAVKNDTGPGYREIGSWQPEGG
jgi:mono/diheme cytochrome c family protein